MRRRERALSSATALRTCVSHSTRTHKKEREEEKGKTKRTMIKRENVDTMIFFVFVGGVKKENQRK